MRLFFIAFISVFWASWAGAEDLPVVELKTPHGFAFTFLRSDVQNTVAVSLALKGGIGSDPLDGPATAFAVSGLIMDGAGGKTASEIYESMQDVGGSFSVTPNPDEIYADLSAPTKGILGAAKLANLILTLPNFPERKFLQSRESFAKKLEEALANPEFAVQNAFMNAAIEPHPYENAIAPRPESARNIQLSDLRPWAARHFKTDGIVISVVGDLEPAEASAVVDALLDNLPATSDLPETPPIKVKATTANPITVAAKTGDQAVLTVGTVITGQLTLDQWFSLDLLSRIFAGDQKSKLFKDIREATGATYGLQSNWNIYGQGSVNLVSGRISKKDADKTIALVKKSWDEFRIAGPSVKDVSNAKATSLQNLGDLQRNHVGMAGYIRDNLTGHMTTAQIASLPSIIENLDLNDKASLARFFPENPIIVVAQ